MLFESEELAELATAPGDRAMVAVAEGRLEDARAIAAASVDAHLPIRDIYTTWPALTLDWIERELGPDPAQDCLTESLRTILRPVAEWFRNGASREAVTSLARMVRMDAGGLDAVTEDEATIVLLASNWAGARVAAIPGLPDLSRVTTVVERWCVGWLGYPPFVLEVAKTGLRVVVHKDLQAIPDAVFARLGVAPDRERIGAAFAVAGAHLFDPGELESMRHQAHRLAVAALDQGDLDRARRHLALSKTEWYPMHHFGRDWVTAMLSWLHDIHGVERTWDCVEAAYNRPIMGQMVAQVGALDLRAQVQMLGTMFHQHGMKFSIVETDGGFEFRTAPCGSGGRLIEEGAYSAPKHFATVRDAGLAGFGLDEMPVYCMHCPATNRMVLEQGGPYFLLVEPDLHPDGTIRGHCRFHIFKHPDAVPTSMYDRVGLPAPAGVTA